MSNERLGRFEIESVLGRGGMGTVYACRDAESGNRVALKVLSGDLVDDQEKFLRFEQEVTALGRLEHPNIVRLLGPLEKDGDKVFFPMEIVKGETLAVKLRREGPQPVPAAIVLATALFRALDAAHRAGVVHRDVKPSNILVDGDNLKVTDFGLARMEDITRLTRTGQLMGTLEYMSPEQCEGEPVDPRTDLYSAGIILYEMLAGKPPFSRRTPGTILKGHLSEIPPPLDDVRADLPEGLGDLVAKLLLKKPEDRFTSAAEALKALASIPDPSTTVTFRAAPSATPEGDPRPPGRRLFLPILIAGSLTVAAVVALLIWYPFEVKQKAVVRITPEDTLEAVHTAIRDRDWANFRECFDPAAIRKVTQKQFLVRATEVADLGYRLEIPLRGAASKDVFFRVGSSPALATILGKSPGATLRVGLEHGDDGFRIVKVTTEAGLPRRPLGPGPGSGRGEFEKVVTRARVTELFDNLDKYAPLLLARLEKEGRITRDQSAAIKERLKELSAKGPFEHRIIDEESTFKGGRLEIVVECSTLAELLGLSDERFSVEFGRRGNGARTPRIRPLGR